MYHQLTVEHKECNLATNWLIVIDDQTEKDFPPLASSIEMLGRAFVVPEGLVQQQINCEL
jgi:hypothetical protein